MPLDPFTGFKYFSAFFAKNLSISRAEYMSAKSASCIVLPVSEDITKAYLSGSSAMIPIALFITFFLVAKSVLDQYRKAILAFSTAPFTASLSIIS